MAIRRIDDLHPGMVIARDVCDRSGRLLLSAGSPLHDRHLTIFRTWGIHEVEVMDPEGAGTHPPDPVSLDPELRAKVEESVVRRFRHTDRNHPAVRVLFEYCVQRLVQKQLCKEADDVD